ncbi:ParB/RepB/Spo0J family partition protein [Flintibacter sp. KGMB00164]|uniref:ParB/RepB/Spo0J family partition protein n=1 Tax=Flintibacter sp. KGMB00164 TaxID=2610895 RepID=UPI0012469CB8|nr:ParB/RepB/Spo0J family partition protein [Flintibacter sp. KGMB00164]
MNLLNDGIKSKAVMLTQSTKKLSIDNHTQVYPVYKIRLDQLYFNDQNDRIATWISQYKAEHTDVALESLSHSDYNDIIQGFIIESNPEAIKKTQNNIDLIGQQEAGVVLTDGRIIDGNRRFTCLRNIEKKTGKTQYFEAVILDHDIRNNAKQIKLLELMIQHGVDKPVDYNPIDRLVGIYNDIVDKRLLTVKEYADGVNQSETDIQREVEKANLMVEFLEFINAPKQFHLARTMNLNDPLKELNTILKQCKDDEKREDLKSVVFANFLMQPRGDMTRYMRKIKKIVSNAKFLDQYLDEQLGTTEKVCDLLEKTPIVTEKVINEKIRTQDDLKEDFAHSTEKWVSKADGDATRNRPAQQAEKAYEMLDTIDTNIFKKLNDEQKDDVRNRLDQIQEALNRIRGELDA